MAAAIGAIITAILVVNNLRDIEQDRAVDKRTIAVRIGTRASMWEYAALMASAYAIVTALVASRALPGASLVVWVSLPLALRSTRRVFTQVGRPLNAALAETGQVALAFSLLFAAGVLIAG